MSVWPAVGTALGHSVGRQLLAGHGRRLPCAAAHQWGDGEMSQQSIWALGSSGPVMYAASVIESMT